MSKAEILVSGATGRTGGVAIDTLLKMDKRVRAYVRKDGEEAASLRKKGVEIAIGDFTDIDAIHAAMQGVRSAYFLHPISPGIVDAETVLTQAQRLDRRLQHPSAPLVCPTSIPGLGDVQRSLLV